MYQRKKAEYKWTEDFLVILKKSNASHVFISLCWYIIKFKISYKEVCGRNQSSEKKEIKKVWIFLQCAVTGSKRHNSSHFRLDEKYITADVIHWYFFCYSDLADLSLWAPDESKWPGRGTGWVHPFLALSFASNTAESEALVPCLDGKWPTWNLLYLTLQNAP